MARINLRRPENISGNFYVDSSCIDCDTCRWMAPEVFSQVGEQSAVYQQPTTETEIKSAVGNRDYTNKVRLRGLKIAEVI